MRFARFATDQIEQMANDILYNLFNDIASYNFRQLLDNKFDIISTIPGGGTFLINILDDISSTFSKFQRQIAKKYVIIYKYFKDDNIVLITHIFHETQDYGKIFQK